MIYFRLLDQFIKQALSAKQESIDGQFQRTGAGMSTATNNNVCAACGGVPCRFGTSTRSSKADTSTATDREIFQDGQRQLAAEKFADEWTPTKGVGYEWVCVYAKDLYSSCHGVFKDLDDKAASIITYLGSGAGLLTIGTVAAFSDGKIDRSVVFLGIPTILLALVALVFALITRWTVAVYLPPTIDGAVQLANYAVTEEKGKVLFAAQIHLCVTMMKPVLKNKAAKVEWSMRCAVLAVVLMILPLAGVVFNHPTASISNQPSVINVQPIIQVPVDKKEPLVKEETGK